MLFAFDTICWLLAVIYILVTLSSAAQLVVIQMRESLPRYMYFVPKTVQQKVHCIVVVIGALRAAFFIEAVWDWNAKEGVVRSDHKSVFYCLDEFSSVLFFSLACILAMFWAELYYIAIDRFIIYSYLVRPITYGINLLAYIAVGASAATVSTSDSGQLDYSYFFYSIVIATVYLLAAAMFTFYGVVSAQELSQVPINLSARQQRLRMLKMLAVITISALVIRAVLMLAAIDQSIVTKTGTELFGLCVYYVALELVPIMTAVAFYRVEWKSWLYAYDYVMNVGSSSSGIQYRSYDPAAAEARYERSPLLTTDSNSSSTAVTTAADADAAAFASGQYSDGALFSSGGSRSGSNNNSNVRVQDEVVNALIDRISEGASTGYFGEGDADTPL